MGIPPPRRHLYVGRGSWDHRLTDNTRDDRIKRVLADIDTAIPSTDPHAERAVEAIRTSTPNHVITSLEEKGTLDKMLEAMTTRFRGRRIADITTTELVQIARDSVDETMGIEPLQRDPQAFPEPRVSELTPEGQALRFMRNAAEVVNDWQDGKVTALAAAEQVERMLHGKTASDH